MRRLDLLTTAMVVSGVAMLIADGAIVGYLLWLLIWALCWMALAPVVLYLLRKDELKRSEEMLRDVAMLACRQGTHDARTTKGPRP